MNKKNAPVMLAAIMFGVLGAGLLVFFIRPAAPLATTSASVQATNQPTITQEPNAAPPSAAQAPATLAQASTLQTSTNQMAKAEEYELIQGPEIGLTASLSITLMVEAPDGSGDIQGTVDFIQVGSTKLELETNDIVHEDNKAWIVTKAYGKIRISGGYAGDHPPNGFCWWLTPSQKVKLKALYDKSK